jgi:hypothetical protein
LAAILFVLFFQVILLIPRLFFYES